MRTLLLRGDLPQTTRASLWWHYRRAIDAACRLKPRDVAAVVNEFDRLLGEPPPAAVRHLKAALSQLQVPTPRTDALLKATVQVALKSGALDVAAQAHQSLCLRMAEQGKTDELFVALWERRQANALNAADLESVLSFFLKRHAFDNTVPWREFFETLPAPMLPALHQVHAVLGDSQKAADLADRAAEWDSALRYLSQVPGTEAACRAAVIASKVASEPDRIAANRHAADCLRQDGRLHEAIEYYRSAGMPERVSDCQRTLGLFADCVVTHPHVTNDWVSGIRAEIEQNVRDRLTAADFIGGARLLRTTKEAYGSRTESDAAQSECKRLAQLLSAVVKTARRALEAELSRVTDDADVAGVQQQWSLFEEAAGNFLEAGLHAESAQDFFRASLLYEKAEAFGQALDALDEADPTGALDRRAELLRRGGDFFTAGMLYAQLGRTHDAIAMFGEAGAYSHAAATRRAELADNVAVFDDLWLELLVKADRVEELARVCVAIAQDAKCPSSLRTRVLRRLEQLKTIGLIDDAWLSAVAPDLRTLASRAEAEFLGRIGTWVETAVQVVKDTYLDTIGIDLGTSNSAVALFNKKTGKAEVVEVGGWRTFPSVLAIDEEGNERVGMEAAQSAAKRPQQLITGAKRLLGTNRQLGLGGRQFRPEEVSARLITHALALARTYVQQKATDHLIEQAVADSGVEPLEEWVAGYLHDHPQSIPFTKAVVAVPAYFNDVQKQATRASALLASLDIARLVHEPTAACLAQGSRHKDGDSILVVDLGAGTLDLALVVLDDGVFEVQEIEGDNALGSIDLDDLLMQHCMRTVLRDTPLAALGDLGAQRLRQACEDLKIALSSHQSWEVRLPHLVGKEEITIALDRHELERLADPWLKRVERTCRSVRGKPSRVLLIGGGSLMPAVRQRVADVFGLKPEWGADPITSVARGAAILAASMAGHAQCLVLDAVPFSLGIKSHLTLMEPQFDIVIRKHARIPIAVTKVYSTLEDDQTSVDIEVYQGEEPRPEANYRIGRFQLEGIPPAKAGIPKIDVTFAIDAQCLLTVTARDQLTGRQRQVSIADSHLITPAQAERLKERLRKSAVAGEHTRRCRAIAEELERTTADRSAAALEERQRRFATSLARYEPAAASFAVTEAEGSAIVVLYREKNDQEAQSRLALDRFASLQRGAESWLRRQSKLIARAAGEPASLEQAITEGEELLARAQRTVQEIQQLTGVYTRWLNLIQNLAPRAAESDAAPQVRRHLSRGHYDRAWERFQALMPPVDGAVADLGLEILGRLRRRDDYARLLSMHPNPVARRRPDFAQLYLTVRLFRDGIVLIQHPGAEGSGFVIGKKEVATNRHVVSDPKTGQLVNPRDLIVWSEQGRHLVQAIHVTSDGRDDVAILRLNMETELTPLRLGFSELVEVGEPVFTLGFPDPQPVAFDENLYCNKGLVNRIRRDPTCSERVLEVSIPLRGGISGAPVLNEMGEVIGLVTFGRSTGLASQFVADGETSMLHLDIECSYHAVPVEVLRRLRREVMEAGQ